MIKKRANIFKMVKSNYWDITHKYGIKVPNPIVKENNNTLLMDAVILGGKNITVEL